MIESIFKLSDSIRYVAVYKNGHLVSQSKSNTLGASSSESDRYEELLVNPTLLKLTSQRGNIDCGGLDYILIRYGNFFQLVVPARWGHVSVCIEVNADPIPIGTELNLYCMMYCRIKCHIHLKPNSCDEYHPRILPGTETPV